MKLNKEVEIGIKAVNVLKNRQYRTRIADIASEVGTTVNFLEQIMRDLRLSGIVTSMRGPGGGYLLNTSKTITAYRVAHALGRFTEAYDAGDFSPENLLRISIVKAFQGVTI